MRCLTILYDAHCAFCVRCRHWLERQRTYLPLVFVPNDDPAVAQHLPLLAQHQPKDLLVLDDQGGVYAGTAAYLMCLWALRAYRTWAIRLSTPKLAPYVRTAFGLLTDHRVRISKLFAVKT